MKQFKLISVRPIEDIIRASEELDPLWALCKRAYVDLAPERRGLLSPERLGPFLPEIMAHRAINHTDHFIENTPEAFEYASKHADVIEIDVQMTGPDPKTEDRAAVVYHDRSIVDAAGKEIKISDLSPQAVLAHRFSVVPPTDPTQTWLTQTEVLHGQIHPFSEFLKRLQAIPKEQRPTLFIDLKHPDARAETTKQLTGYVGNVRYIGEEPGEIKAMADQTTYPFTIIHGNEPPTVSSASGAIKLAAEHKASYVFVFDFDSLDKLFSVCHNKKIQLVLGIINNEDRFVRAMLTHLLYLFTQPFTLDINDIFSPIAYIETDNAVAGLRYLEAFTTFVEQALNELTSN